jgi:two-component system heavy metal sensor histidine kinase CusS
MFWKNARNKDSPSRLPAPHWSIARRLTLFYVAATAILLVLAVGYLYWSQVSNLEREDTDFLVNKIQDCRRVLQERPNDTTLLVNEIQVEAAASIIKYYVRLQDERGRILLETSGMNGLLPMALFPPSADLTEIPTRGTVRKSSTGQACLLMSAKAPVNLAGTPTRTLQVALDISAEEELIAGYRRKLLAVVLLGSSFAWVVGAFVTNKGLKPLKDITQATERVTASQLHERIVANGWPEELASLARSFDGMLDRLEDSFKRLSQFSADLAHELRTPINNLRGEAGVALSQARSPGEYRHTIESSLEEYARLTRLIDNILFLARADGPRTTIARVPCDTRKAIEVVREFYEALAEDRGVKVHCEGQGMVSADPVLFRQAVSNLLSNALNYTPPKGRVLIRLHERGNHGFEVCVSDTGCGISADHLPRIFDRFYRVDPSRSQHPNGTGLGLAIVKSIMTLHGGNVNAESEVGKGTSFTLIFPAAEING